jgi:hypothetical protein
VAEVWYGGSVAAISGELQAAGIGHVDLYLDLLFGWPLARGLYVLGLLDCYATRFSDSYGGYLALTGYELELGGRWYPFGSGPFLQITAGGAVAAMDSNIGISGQSPLGYAAGAVLGWDFGDAGGLSLVVGVSASYLSVPEWQSFGIGFSGNLAWKPVESVRR